MNLYLEILQKAVTGEIGCGWDDVHGVWHGYGSKPGHCVLGPHTLTWKTFNDYVKAAEVLVSFGLLAKQGLSSCGWHYALTEQGRRVAESEQEVSFA